MLNKDLLRLFFVLEGFRQRKDLEDRIDWMGKGRVLVYEKVTVRSDKSVITDN